MAEYYRTYGVGKKARPSRSTLVYYAHCMALYDSAQERRDVALLERLGFEVLNPNQAKHQKGAQDAKAKKPLDPKASMMYFKPLVDMCDLLAFRALPGDLAIPAGVALEIEWALNGSKPVIELPGSIQRRAISREETREYICEVGKW